MKPLLSSTLALVLLSLLPACHREKPEAAEKDKEKPRSTLSFYAVSEEKIPGGRYIDTPEWPKLGNIGPAPDLAVSSLQAVIPSAVPPGPLLMDKDGEIHGNANKTLPALLLKLHPQDGKKLTNLTEGIKGRRLLVMLDDTPLTAPMITAPIPGGVLLFPFNEKSDRARIQDDLEKMAK